MSSAVKGLMPSFTAKSNKCDKLKDTLIKNGFTSYKVDLSSQMNEKSRHDAPSHGNYDLNELRARFLEKLKIFGLKENSFIVPDANCLFSSVSDQFYSKTLRHDLVRNRAVNWLINCHSLESQSKIQYFLNRDKYTMKEYCDYMIKDKSWGDQLILIAIAESYKVRILVISSNHTITDYLPAVFDKNEHNTILIFQYGDVHYGSLTFQ